MWFSNDGETLHPEKLIQNPTKLSKRPDKCSCFHKFIAALLLLNIDNQHFNNDRH